MYKIFVAVSGKRVRIVPAASKPHVAERDFGDLSQEDALANRDNLFDAIRGLLLDQGIEDAELYTIEVPDDLAPRNIKEQDIREEETKKSKNKDKVAKTADAVHVDANASSDPEAEKKTV